MLTKSDRLMLMHQSETSAPLRRLLVEYDKLLDYAGAVTQKDSVKIEAHVPRALKAAV